MGTKLKDTQCETTVKMSCNQLIIRERSNEPLPHHCMLIRICQVTEGRDHAPVCQYNLKKICIRVSLAHSLLLLSMHRSLVYIQCQTFDIILLLPATLAYEYTSAIMHVWQ